MKKSGPSTHQLKIVASWISIPFMQKMRMLIEFNFALTNIQQQYSYNEYDISFQQWNKKTSSRCESRDSHKEDKPVSL